MSILSLTFIVFLMVTTAVYYTVPKKAQWIILLLASGIFYLLSSIRGVFFVLFTATTVYLATNRMQNLLEIQNHYLKENKETLSKEEKRAYKTNIKSKRKRTMISTLVLNFGILCIIKYTHFAIEQINLLINCFGGIEISNDFTLAAPLGISFYTFQSTGYLLDVFWEKQSAEKNYFKTLLFISFFPQITQGPISGFEELSAELFSKHSFLYKNYSWGAQRIIWGYFKKMVIANGVAKCVQDVFANYSQYSGISVLIGAFLYSVQIYADFSGYMDIMCGFCEVLDIRLAENFERPYFSKSVAEYWRRWHITLGAWFKNYIYYPIGMSNWNRQLAFRIKNRYGRQLAYTIPASAALIIVWLATGAWHGASWSYIVWGLLNGFFIIFSIWMEPVYDKWRSITKVNRHSWEWKIFQTIRTFVLILIIVGFINFFFK